MTAIAIPLNNGRGVLVIDAECEALIAPHSWSNLRQATSTDNGRNKRSLHGSTSRFVGVGWYRQTSRWRAYITLDHATANAIHLGYFNTEEEAARARDRAALEHFGDFAHLNFPTRAESAAHG